MDSDSEESEEESQVTTDTQLPTNVGRRIAFGLQGRQWVQAPEWTFKSYMPAEPLMGLGSWFNILLLEVVGVP